MLLLSAACDSQPGDASDRDAQLEAEMSWRPQPLGPPTVVAALARAADESGGLDDGEQQLLDFIIDDFAYAQQRHAQAKDAVNAALAAGAEACDFDSDQLAAALQAAAASAEEFGAAEVEALDALHELLNATQRMRVVRTALNQLRSEPQPSRSFIRVLARTVELTDDQILAAADGLADAEPQAEDHLFPADPTALLEAFSGKRFNAARFDLKADMLARTEARRARLISSLEVFCPVLDADQRVALAGGLLKPFADPGPSSTCNAEAR